LFKKLNCLGEAYTVLALFVFRYVQTTGHRWLYLFSNMRYYFLGYIAYIFTVIICLLPPLYFQMLFTGEARIAFREDVKISELIKNEPLVFAINVGF
jgi:membrane-bound metal-dependent hydrolase YbcI (DUF457 family)